MGYKQCGKKKIEDYIVLKEGLGFYNNMYYFSWYE